jgi:hypothetical protein
MNGAIFHIPPIENRDDFNELPSRREMTGASLYWSMVASVLGNSVAPHVERPDPGLEALRKNGEHYAKQRPVIAELAGAVVADAVAGLVPAKPQTEIARATEWLAATLNGQLGGRLPSKQVETLAVKAGISLRTLRRAAKSAGIRHVRNRDKSWSYVLIRSAAKPGRVA